MPAGTDMRIGAVVTKGGGWASGTSNSAGLPGTIERQKPFITKYVAALDGCYNGTINLMLDSPIGIRRHDVVTEPIVWMRNRAGEIFEITEVGLELGDTRHRAWIYTPHDSPHRLDRRIVELLAQPIEGITPGTRCAIVVTGESQPFEI